MKKIWQKILLPIAIFSAGCTSQDDYKRALEHTKVLEAKVESLTGDVEKLKAELESRTKELEDVKFGPSRLLAQAKESKSSKEAVELLTKLINKHPTAKESKEASGLLEQAKSRLAATELDDRRAAAAKSTCVIEGSKVPANFNGVDVRKIIKSFRSVKAKDQFESSAAYKSRLAKEVEAIASLTQCVAINGNYNTEYDADKGNWLLGIRANQYTLWDHHYIYEILEENLSSSSYEGENAFGVKRQIRRTEDEAFGVALSKSAMDKVMRSLGAKKDYISYVIPVPVSPEKAKGISKSDLKLLVQYQWVPDYVGTKYDSTSPTISMPYDKKTTSYYLFGRPTKVFIMNSRTGEILAAKSVQ